MGSAEWLCLFQGLEFRGAKRGVREWIPKTKHDRIPSVTGC